MFNIGPLELMVILIVALLVVGPTKLPEIGRSIGRGLREFRKAQDEVQRTLRLSFDDTDEPPSRPMRSAATRTAEDEAGAAPATGSGDAAAPGSDDDAASGHAAAAATPTEERTAADDVAKALGRGLAELRRAKEELQSSFRVDLNDRGGDGSRTG
jgi:sec-independent protein translocase protein TatA